MIELSRRILQFLRIDGTIKFDGAVHSYGIPGDERTPVYPSVIQNLGLDNKYKYLLYKLPISGNKVSFKEYMASYMRRIFPELRKNEKEDW